MNRQKALLLIFSVLLIAAVFYAYFRTPRQQTVDQLKHAQGITAQAKKGEPAQLDGRRLHLELLDKEMPRFAGFKRNIFWFAPLETNKKLPPPPPPPPPPPQAIRAPS